MTHDEAIGLIAFWADIDPDYETRFLEWHNCEHMPERVLTGVSESRRYRALGRSPRYLMMYFTNGANLLGSRAYMERLGHPTPWTREAFGHFRNPSRNVYTVLAGHGRTSLRESPYLISIRFDVVHGGGVAEDHSLLHEWSALPGVGRVKLYGIDAVDSSIKTAERGIYEGRPDSQRHLLLIECAHPQVTEQVSDHRRTRWLGMGEEGSGAPVAHVIRETFRIDYVLPAEDRQDYQLFPE